MVIETKRLKIIALTQEQLEILVDKSKQIAMHICG